MSKERKKNMHRQTMWNGKLSAHNRSSVIRSVWTLLKEFILPYIICPVTPGLASFEFMWAQPCSDIFNTFRFETAKYLFRHSKLSKACLIFLQKDEKKFTGAMTKTRKAARFLAKSGKQLRVTCMIFCGLWNGNLQGLEGEWNFLQGSMQVSYQAS